MSNKTEVTQEEIGILLTLIIDTVNENIDFLDLNKQYTNTLDFKSLDYWENEIGILSHPICKILIPMAMIKAIENDDKLNVGKVISFIKFILTLTVRFMNKIADLKSINNLVFLACDNIDTWLLRNLSLRPIPFLNTSNKAEINTYVKDNFLGYVNKEAEHTLVYEEMNELIDLILDAKVKIQLGEELDDYEKETIINVIADHIRILMEKARHHKGSIAICSYCNCMYYYTHENKMSNQFLSLSPLQHLCSECFIEANKTEYKCKDIYLKTYNKETKKEQLRYLIFSTEWSSNLN